MRTSPYLREIERLDPVRDHERIVYLDACFEFPFDTTRSLELALFRTFAVPSIGGLLDATGEFRHHAQKRYDDTDLIISTSVEHGYASSLGRTAVRRMNQIHGRFAISNDDFLYVLSTFVYEPIRWNERFGWRRLVEQERLAAFHFWRRVGQMMNIRDIPGSYEELEFFNVAYEREHIRFTPEARRVGIATRDMFLRWFPWIPKRVGARAIHALLDDPLLDAFGFPRPTALERRLVESGLRLRARAVGALPPRRRPRVRTEMRHRTYPRGYRIGELGPPAQATRHTAAGAP